MLFSPDQSLLLTGTSVKRGEGTGLVVFYDTQTYEKVMQLGVAPASVVSILWHPTINQIVVGDSEYNAHVYFDPKISEKGALLCATRAPRRKHPEDMEFGSNIINPHALDMFKAPRSRKRQREKDRKDPIKSRRPDLPVSGPGRSGKLGTSLTQHIMKSQIKQTFREEDPRDAFLRHAEEAEQNPVWFGVYKQTQPKPIFAEAEDNGEEESEEASDQNTASRPFTYMEKK